MKDIMRRQVVTIDSSMTIKDAAKMMEDSKVSCLVVTEENTPKGILTERDFVTKITSTEKSPSISVREVMSSPLIAITPSATAKNLAELMKETKIHKVPVVDDIKVIGIVTATDLIRKCVLNTDMRMREICSSFAQMAF